MTDKTRCLDDLEHLIIVSLNQRQLEPVLCRIDFQNSGLGTAVQAVDVPALDLDEINSLVEGADNAIVTITISACVLHHNEDHTYPLRREYLTWFKVE